MGPGGEWGPPFPREILMGNNNLQPTVYKPDKTDKTITNKILRYGHNSTGS